MLFRSVLAALVSSGFQTDSFTFLGFPPWKAAARRVWMNQLAIQPRTVVFFEAPHRLRKTLEELAQVLGERPICLAKELTKIHEKLVVRPIYEILRLLEPIKGEYVIVVPPGREPAYSGGQLPTDEELSDYFGRMTEFQDDSKRARIGQTARHFGLPSRQVYTALERTKKQQKSTET